MAKSFGKQSKKTSKSSNKKKQNKKSSGRASRSATPEPSPVADLTHATQSATIQSPITSPVISHAESSDALLFPDNSNKLKQLNTDINKTDCNAEQRCEENAESSKKKHKCSQPEESEEVVTEIQQLGSSRVKASDFEYQNIKRDMESVKSLRSVKSQYEDVTNDIPGLIINDLLSGDELGVVHGDGSLINDLEIGNENQTNYGSTVAPAAKSINAGDALELPVYKRTIILMSMYLGILLAALDVSIISTLLPHIASEFNALDKVTQIVTAYLLSSATVQPLYGKISDIYGRKPVLIICNIVFATGCLICGQKDNTFRQLIWGRILQGIGGSGLTSVATITTSDLVSLKERAFYQGIGNFFYAIGIASGGVIGGILNDKFNWRFSFTIQVPLSILSLITIVIFMKLPSGTKKYTGLSNYQKLKAIDWTGSIVLMAFLFTFSYGGSWYIYISSLLLLLLLVKIETSLTSKEPILPIHFLKIKSVFGAAWSNFLVMATSVVCMFYLPMYWTTILNLSTTETGLRLTPNFFSTAFGSLGAGIYMKKTGKYYNFLMAFCVVGVLGCLRLIFITPNIAVWQQYLCLVVPGFAMSVMITINLLIMIAAVPPEDQAACTSISYAFRSTGSTVGISLAGLIFSKKLHSQLLTRVLPYASDDHPKDYLLKIIASAEKSSDFLKTAPEWIKPVLKTCFHYALKNTFIFTFVTFLLSALFVSICDEYQLFTN